VTLRLTHYPGAIEDLAGTKLDLILRWGYHADMNQRLTKDQAQSIINRVAAGEPQKTLAAELGVTPSTVSNIVKGKSWPGLERPSPPLVVVRGSKLKPEDIPVILTRLAKGEKPSTIAKDYRVTRQAIADIKRGKTWVHIPRPVITSPRRRRVWEHI